MQDIIQHTEVIQQLEILENEADLRNTEVTPTGIGEFVYRRTGDPDMPGIGPVYSRYEVKQRRLA